MLFSFILLSILLFRFLTRQSYRLHLTITVYQYETKDYWLYYYSANWNTYIPEEEEPQLPSDLIKSDIWIDRAVLHFLVEEKDNNKHILTLYSNFFISDIFKNHFLCKHVLFSLLPESQSTATCLNFNYRNLGRLIYYRAIRLKLC